MARTLGGDWTERKLQALENYLESYLTALKKQRHRFKLGYIDAFAGDGSLIIGDNESEPSLFEDALPTSQPEVKGLIEGSATRALNLEPGFDTYILVEKDKEAADRLRNLKDQHRSKDIRIEQEDANAYLQSLGPLDWSERRAVVFLDPTGMQVRWKTMQALAQTGALDVWIWFPIGVAVNRLLPRDGNIPEGWARALDRIFGTRNWREAFYEAKETDPNLFPNQNEEELRKTADIRAIAEYYNERLKTTFPAVAPNPRILSNSGGTPIYLLCFASANPGAGGHIAVRIAKHLLDNM